MSTTVKSDVAGTMWKIHVSAGDAVSKGMELCILESMKMEIPVMAPVAGKVDSILVVEGDTVAKDAPLIVIA